VRRRADELRARVNPSVPTTVKADLRPYQVEGFHFLAYLAANHFGGVLADDMGLGKTLQTLTWLAWLKAQPDCPKYPSLVVCPKSVTANWQSESNRFVPHLRVKIWTGGSAAELKSTVEECDLLVMNFAQLRLNAKTLATGDWHAVILDEAQAIKNPDSQTTKAACALRAVHRLAVTGTPVENRLLDLWSIFSFGMPGMLGVKSRFSRDYDKPTDPLARRRLSARVRPFLLRRTKSQVAKDLPPRMEEDLLCDLEGKQETLYRAELKRAQQMLLRIKTNKELDKQRFNVLTSLLRLRQICCHAALVDKKAPRSESAKLEALMEMLEPLMEEGHKVLVFSQFVSALEIIEAEIAERDWKRFVLTGETENRGELVQEFQGTEGAAVFLLSLKAGGAGLNLTAASYVVLFDPWWNPAVENQAIDRTHRIGQKQQVNAYRLLIRGSIEEKIRALQRDKSALADEVLGEEAFARGLTLEDLSFLLSDEEAPVRR
jgi:SNF2 family DNA or RNA helicase